MGQSDSDGEQHEMQKVQEEQEMYQNVIVMRHGERKDNAEPLWATKASRPWDPPLTDEGKVGAFCVGRKFRTHLNFPIHRVFVSPFLRCLQTANEVVSALSAVDDNPISVSSSYDVTIDPSKVKISVEYGLCEMMNSIAIRPEMAPKDGNFDFDISKCEACLPAGTIDHSVERVYTTLPQWEETLMGAQSRYLKVIKTLLDRYPSENLLFVTHGEGVGAAAFKKDFVVAGLEYCAYLQARRTICSGEIQSSTAGDFLGDFVHVSHPDITYCVDEQNAT